MGTVAAGVPRARRTRSGAEPPLRGCPRSHPGAPREPASRRSTTGPGSSRRSPAVDGRADHGLRVGRHARADDEPPRPRRRCQRNARARPRARVDRGSGRARRARRKEPTTMTTTTTTTIRPRSLTLRDDVQAEAHRRMPDHIAAPLAHRRRDARASTRGAARHARPRRRALAVPCPSAPRHRPVSVRAVGPRRAAGDDQVRDDERVRRRGHRSATQPRRRRRRRSRQRSTSPGRCSARYLCMASGGSSGERGRFVFDRHASVEFFCSLQRPLMRRLAAMGARRRVGSTVAMVGAASAVHATGSRFGHHRGRRRALRRRARDASARGDRRAAEHPPAADARAATRPCSPDWRRSNTPAACTSPPLSISATSETLLPEHRSAIADGLRSADRQHVRVH